MRYIPEPCSYCGGMIYPVRFMQEEYKEGHLTGRVRLAVSHLECNQCGKQTIVDDSMDGPWEYKRQT